MIWVKAFIWYLILVTVVGGYLRHQSRLNDFRDVQGSRRNNLNSDRLRKSGKRDQKIK